MSVLGDAFPPEWRENLANENLKVGAVIKLKVPDTTPPKIKRLVVVGIDNTKVLLATIFINTEININVLNTPELQNLQYELTKTNCPYLDYNSFADCSKIRERNYSDILDFIKKNPGSHLGQLLDEDLSKVKALIKSARTIPVRLKKQFNLFL